MLNEIYKKQMEEFDKEFLDKKQTIKFLNYETFNNFKSFLKSHTIKLLEEEIKWLGKEFGVFGYAVDYHKKELEKIKNN
jgi:hypothetical protein